MKYFCFGRFYKATALESFSLTWGIIDNLEK